jgi:hypothetical protein
MEEGWIGQADALWGRNQGRAFREMNTSTLLYIANGLNSFLPFVGLPVPLD